jgi:hypothetical protein
VPASASQASVAAQRVQAVVSVQAAEAEAGGPVRALVQVSEEASVAEARAEEVPLAEPASEEPAVWKKT